MERLSGISRQFLSSIENAYSSPKRGFVLPSDQTLERLSETLDIPLSRLHALLGRFPDEPLTRYEDPESLVVADAYDRLPALCKRIVRDALQTAEAIAAELRAQEDSRSRVVKVPGQDGGDG
jgi:transcriptional regulator with XRE-family HTH domain